MIYIRNKRSKLSNLQKEYPDAFIIDVTSKGPDPYVKLSPFYPHGGIPVPFSEGVYSMSVEGVWQALKIFEHSGIDLSKLKIDTMKNLKRTSKSLGRVLGHQKGVKSQELLDYGTARKQIYLPVYFWMLDNKVNDIAKDIAEKSQTKDVVLLDYNTNQDINNLATPLSHAFLVKEYITGIIK